MRAQAAIGGNGHGEAEAARRTQQCLHSLLRSWRRRLMVIAAP
jgi:hypothetical protein